MNLYIGLPVPYIYHITDPVQSHIGLPVCLLPSSHCVWAKLGHNYYPLLIAHSSTTPDGFQWQAKKPFRSVTVISKVIMVGALLWHLWPPRHHCSCLGECQVANHSLPLTAKSFCFVLPLNVLSYDTCYQTENRLLLSVSCHSLLSLNASCVITTYAVTHFAQRASSLTVW